MFAQNRIDFPVPKSFSGIDYGWSFINRNRVFYRRTFGSCSVTVQRDGIDYLNETIVP